MFQSTLGLPIGSLGLLSKNVFFLHEINWLVPVLIHGLPYLHILLHCRPIFKSEACFFSLILDFRHCLELDLPLRSSLNSDEFDNLSSKKLNGNVSLFFLNLECRDCLGENQKWLLMSWSKSAKLDFFELFERPPCFHAWTCFQAFIMELWYEQE